VILLIFVLVLVLLFAVQTTFLELFSVGGVMPDLALIFVVYCGIHFLRNGGIGVGVLVGFIQDCLSGALFGVNTLSKGLTGLFFSALKDKIIVKGVLPISFFLVATSLFDGVIYFSAVTSLMGGQIKADFMFSRILVFAVFNAVAGLFLFYVLDAGRQQLHRKFPNQVLRST
jgi:rod shape-determining protein MreD